MCAGSGTGLLCLQQLEAPVTTVMKPVTTVSAVPGGRVAPAHQILNRPQTWSLHWGAEHPQALSTQRFYCCTSTVRKPEFCKWGMWQQPYPGGSRRLMFRSKAVWLWTSRLTTLPLHLLICGMILKIPMMSNTSGSARRGRVEGRRVVQGEKQNLGSCQALWAQAIQCTVRAQFLTEHSVVSKWKVVNRACVTSLLLAIKVSLMAFQLALTLCHIAGCKTNIDEEDPVFCLLDHLTDTQQGQVDSSISVFCW